MPQATKISDAKKQQWTRKRKKLETIPAWVLRGDTVKDDYGALCSVYWTWLISVTNDGRKSKCMLLLDLPDCDGQAADAISAYTQVKNGGCSKTNQNSQIRMSGCMGTSSRTWMAEVTGTHWRSCFSSWTKLIRTPTCGTLVGKTVRESVKGTWLGKSTKLGMLIRP